MPWGSHVLSSLYESLPTIVSLEKAGPRPIKMLSIETSRKGEKRFGKRVSINLLLSLPQPTKNTEERLTFFGRR